MTAHIFAGLEIVGGHRPPLQSESNSFTIPHSLRPQFILFVNIQIQTKRSTADLQTNYLLIDYENVQPKDLSILCEHGFRVRVFVGASQARIPLELAESLQPLGTAVEYVQISGNGRNALDFHIAFMMGQLATEDTDANFHIISKDTGYDPLIDYVNRPRIRCHRYEDIALVPAAGSTRTKNVSERLDLVLKNLKARESGRPRKEETLRNAIQSLFQKKLADNEVQQLIQELKKKKHIRIQQNGSVSYQLTAIQ